MSIAGGLTISSAAYAHHETDSLPIYPHEVPDECTPQSIRVTITGATHVGLVKLELYDDLDTDDFLKKKGRLRRIRVPASDQPIALCINVDRLGQYALAGYHDIDADRKIDKKWNFKPKEPIGLSNPDYRSKKIPKFEDGAFDVGPDGADIIFNLVDPKRD